jgi:hypothetical protein
MDKNNSCFHILSGASFFQEKRGTVLILKCLLIVLIFAVCYSQATAAHGEEKQPTAQGRGTSKTGSGVADIPSKEMSADCLSCFRESMQVTREHGDRVWKGFGQMNIRVNVITPHYEFFFGDPTAPAGYQPYIESSRLPGKSIFYKKREYRHEFISAIEKVEGRPALFISSKEIYEKTYLHSPLYKIAEDYIFTLIQNYFHLYLMNNEALFNAKRAALAEQQVEPADLKKKYPYLDFINAELLELEGKQLREAYQAKELGRTREHTLNFLRLRKMRQRQMKEEYGIDCAAYENWLEWYDGLARYTEIQLAESITPATCKPCKGMMDVSNFKRYVYVKNKTAFEMLRLKSTKNSLIHSAMGMTEAMILDKLEIKWKDRLFEPGLYLIDFLGESFQKELAPRTFMQ